MRNCLTITALFILASCGILQPRNDLTIEEKESLIHNAAQGSTVAAILNLYEERDQLSKAIALKEVIDDRVLTFLSSDAPVSIDIVQQLFNQLPPEHAVYTQIALNLLNLYYIPPETSELLDEEGRRLITALFKGISDGCQIVIGLAWYRLC